MQFSEQAQIVYWSVAFLFAITLGHACLMESPTDLAAWAVVAIASLGWIVVWPIVFVVWLGKVVMGWAIAQWSKGND